jgi:membrane protease YdiL (CAAX protease family)
MVKIVFFSFGFSFFNEQLAISLAIITLTFLIFLISKNENISLSLKPDFSKNSKNFYILFTLFTIIIFITTPFITNSVNFGSIFILIGGTLLFPIFEEILFRGYIWNKLEKEGFNKISIFIFTILLFGFWHLGYIDSIMLRVPLNNLPFIIEMKVVTGFLIGVMVGLAKYKTDNIYLGLLIHILINIFGR